MFVKESWDNWLGDVAVRLSVTSTALYEVIALRSDREGYPEDVEWAQQDNMTAAEVFTAGQSMARVFESSRLNLFLGGVVALYAAGFRSDAALTILRLMSCESGNQAVFEYALACAYFIPVVCQRLDGIQIVIPTGTRTIAVPEFAAESMLVDVANSHKRDAFFVLLDRVDAAFLSRNDFQCESECSFSALLRRIQRSFDSGHSLATVRSENLLFWESLVFVAQVLSNGMPTSRPWIEQARSSFLAYAAAASIDGLTRGDA